MNFTICSCQVVLTICFKLEVSNKMFAVYQPLFGDETGHLDVKNVLLVTVTEKENLCKSKAVHVNRRYNSNSKLEIKVTRYNATM